MTAVILMPIKATTNRILARLLVLFFVLHAVNFLLVAQSFEFAYDIVIRNGRVLDGAGNPWISADVAISDGKFVRIGHVAGQGKREIDGSKTGTCDLRTGADR